MRTWSEFEHVSKYKRGLRSALLIVLTSQSSSGALANARPSCGGAAATVRTMRAIIWADNRASLNDVLPHYTRSVIWSGPSGVLRGFEQIKQSYKSTYSHYRMNLKMTVDWEQGDSQVAYVAGRVIGWLTDKASSQRKEVNDQYVAVLRCNENWRVELLTWASGTAPKLRRASSPRS